ncbi:Major Facilitator Superfamily protein [Pseudomonas sp. NFR09]|uniref:MFS transporter n=1 Tax=Pseudomonas sp. NFR09 TaxID=1566249 RepID=UPI0008BF9929|nr:MFS transporter [Pseudomonas sp. NFR09]SET65025.1 Major Facilitator Superfamily protein [Pseudomonas sp. NFR09]
MTHPKKFSLTSFIIARGFGLLADEMFLFAVPVALYVATGELAWVGLSVMGLTVWRVLLLPWLALYIDRHRLRPQLLSIDAGRIVLTALMALTIRWHWVTIALAGALALLNTYSFIMLEKTVASHSAPHELGRLQARLQTIEQIARVVAPSVGGFTLYLGGLRMIALVACAIFACSLCSLWFGFRPDEDKPVPGKHSSVLKGVRTLWSRPRMVWLVAVSMASNLVESLLMSLAPMMFITRFHMTEVDLGTFLSVTAAVSIAVLSVLSLRGHVYIGRTFAHTLLIAMAVVALVIPMANTLGVFAGLYLAFIIMRTVFVIHVRTERARAIPSADFGKALGVMIALLQLPIPVSGFLISMSTRLHIPIDRLQWGATCVVIVACGVLALFLRHRTRIPKLTH